jgi:hypothetical protein
VVCCTWVSHAARLRFRCIRRRSRSRVRPHRGGIDRRLGPHAPAEEHGDFLGVALVIVGLAAVDRFHSARVAEDHREAFWRPQVGAPVPRQAALHGDHHAPPLRALGRSFLLGTARWSVCGKISCWGLLKRLPHVGLSEGLFERRVTVLADLPQGGLKGVRLYWSRKDQTPLDKGYRYLCRR